MRTDSRCEIRDSTAFESRLSHLESLPCTLYAGVTPLDSATKMGIALLLVGMAAVIALMLKLHGHLLYEAILAAFLIGQVVNLAILVKGSMKR